MKSVEYTPVGIVKNGFNEAVSPNEIKSQISTLVIDKQYAEALLNISECQYLDVVFYFHKSESGHLSGITYSGDLRGVFASRSPKRPNLIGITSVKLLSCNGNELEVEGLDAINGTPVLDIKCSDTSLFTGEFEKNQVHIAALKSNPRIDLINNIKNKQSEALMIKAAQMHGHYCPGLAMGIMAASYAMNQLGAQSDGMEDLLAITETNNCFSDGIQFVTGCSFGNNSLIYHDLGKTAFTLALRNGKGIRVVSKPESQEIINSAFPDFSDLYQQVVVQQNHTPALMAKYKKTARRRAFGTLDLPFDQMFAVSEVEIELPGYAAIRKSIICEQCAESVMETRTVNKNGNKLCYACAEEDFARLTGNGISCR
jgi:formylmethanofuran dehydrogenase subunit E